MMKHWNRAAIGGSLLAVLLVIAGCESEQGPAEEAGEQIDETVENVQDSAEDAAESAGDQVEEAADELEEKTD